MTQAYPDLDAERLFDALGNAQRRQLLVLLSQRPHSVNELTLASSPRISRPAISRHLRQLIDAQLVRFSVHGNQHLYELNLDGFALARQWLESFWDEALVRLALVAQHPQPPPTEPDDDEP